MLEKAAVLVEKLKEILEDIAKIDWEVGVFDIIIKLTSWEGDDIALQWLRNNFPALVEKITGIVVDYSKGIDNAIRIFLEWVNSLSEIMEGKAFLALASELTQGLVENKSGVEVNRVYFDTVMQVKYAESVL